jgi:hypothetical protein
MNDLKEIKEYLYKEGYRMTMVMGAFKYYSHFEKSTLILRDSPNVELFMKLDINNLNKLLDKD